MLPIRGRARITACSITPRSPRALRSPRAPPCRARFAPGKRNEKAALRARPLTLVDAFSGWISRGLQPHRKSLVGGAEIVGRRLARAAVRHDLVGDLLAFTQRTEAGALNGRDVHEHIVAAVIRLDEAIALGCVKPLHGSHAHGGSPFSEKIVSKPTFDGLVRSNFWKGRQRLNRRYRWIANVVRPKIDCCILSEAGSQNNPDGRDF